MLKRFVLTLIGVLILTGPVFAQTLTSVQVMPLTQSAQFLNRVTFQIVLTAPTIETEAASYTPPAGDTHPSTPSCHSLRATTAAAVAKNPSVYASIFALHLVTSGNVTTAGALIGSLTAGTLDTPATDAALFSAVNAVWSDTSGCITNQ